MSLSKASRGPTKAIVSARRLYRQPMMANDCLYPLTVIEPGGRGHSANPEHQARRRARHYTALISADIMSLL